MWKTYTLTILFQNSNCDIVIKPFLRSEKMKLYFYTGCFDFLGKVNGPQEREGKLLGITNCKIIISMWKTYTLTILFQNSNCDIVIKPFLRSEKMKLYFYTGTP